MNNITREELIYQIAKTMHDASYETDLVQKGFWSWRSEGIKTRWIRKATIVIEEYEKLTGHRTPMYTKLGEQPECKINHFNKEMYDEAF